MENNAYLSEERAFGRFGLNLKAFSLIQEISSEIKNNSFIHNNIDTISGYLYSKNEINSIFASCIYLSSGIYNNNAILIFNSSLYIEANDTRIFSREMLREILAAYKERNIPLCYIIHSILEKGNSEENRYLLSIVNFHIKKNNILKMHLIEKK